MHQRLALGPHPGGGHPLAKPGPGQRAIGGQRRRHRGHPALGVLPRHSFLR